MAALLGAHPSELGALNAANASPTALANAAPNSRVGRIATYRDTVLAGEPLREELEEQLEFLEGLEEPDRTVQEIDDDLEVALGEVQTNRDTVAELEQALEDAGGSDPDIEAQLEEAQAELDASIDEAQTLNDERQAAIEYNEAVEEVEELTELVEEQDLAEREALEAAANKPVTDAVEEQVKALLGL
jgi:chromosome segregation ATPase